LGRQAVEIPHSDDEVTSIDPRLVRELEQKREPKQEDKRN